MDAIGKVSAQQQQQKTRQSKKKEKGAERNNLSTDLFSGNAYFYPHINIVNGFTPFGETIMVNGLWLSEGWKEKGGGGRLNEHSGIFGWAQWEQRRMIEKLLTLHSLSRIISIFDKF